MACLTLPLSDTLDKLLQYLMPKLLQSDENQTELEKQKTVTKDYIDRLK